MTRTVPELVPYAISIQLPLSPEDTDNMSADGFGGSGGNASQTSSEFEGEEGINQSVL